MVPACCRSPDFLDETARYHSLIQLKKYPPKSENERKPNYASTWKNR
jgi:hypothetical protein